MQEAACALYALAVAPRQHQPNTPEFLTLCYYQFSLSFLRARKRLEGHFIIISKRREIRPETNGQRHGNTEVDRVVEVSRNRMEPPAASFVARTHARSANVTGHDRFVFETSTRPQHSDGRRSSRRRTQLTRSGMWAVNKTSGWRGETIYSDGNLTFFSLWKAAY